MADPPPLYARISIDVASLVLALTLLGYGLVRGGGLHVAYFPLVGALALAYGAINRTSFAGDWRTVPPTLRAIGRRILPYVGMLVAIGLYGELAFDGDESGDRIVTLAGIPLAMALASLYFSLRSGER